MRTIRSEQSGQIVTGWLIKLVIGLALVGLIGFEVVGVVLARGSASEVARRAAEESGFRWRDTQNVREAEQTARDWATKEGAEFVSITVDPRANELTVKVRKRAKTFWIQNIGPLKKFTVANGTATTPLP